MIILRLAFGSLASHHNHRHHYFLSIHCLASLDVAMSTPLLITTTATASLSFTCLATLGFIMAMIVVAVVVA
jgi:hypothetical protein